MTQNPYATALDGLALDDPVAAFFAFCREREAVRIRRASGKPSPWSEDPILQRGRFLNVFREDDRTTKSIFNFLAPLATPFHGDGSRSTQNSRENLEDVVHALFFARWCNSQMTLDSLNVGMLRQGGEGGDEGGFALHRRLDAMASPPWCNVTAYPVEPITFDCGDGHGAQQYSRLDAAARLFGTTLLRKWLLENVLAARGNVVTATRAISSAFGMSNDFPVFMAVMDIAWFYPDVIDPASHVPTGIGAVAFLDRLQAHLDVATHDAAIDAIIAQQPVQWPDARRALLPIDVEYLSCECRKYYSYVNGTKQFEGKNIFKPGLTPSLEFDVKVALEVPSADNIAQIPEVCVIAGGPCSGKSTLCSALQEAGYTVVPETAEMLIQAGVRAGLTAEQVRLDPVAWQMDLLQQDYELFDGLLRGMSQDRVTAASTHDKKDGLVFADTSFVEDIVYARRAGIEMGPGVKAWLARLRYAQVFFLEPLQKYESTEVRLETQNLAEKLSEEIRACYESEQGYQLSVVPAIPTTERVQILLAQLGSS